MDEGKQEEIFSVTQFFADESYETVKTHVPVEEAVLCAKGLIQSLGGRLGTTQRIIITDWGDCICLEWIYGKGIVYPPAKAERSDHVE